MDEIRDWLRSLDLEAYADAFERERMDLGTVHTLSDADLRELGLPMGPRNKLKAAIAALGSRDGISTGISRTAQPRAATSSAERRRQPLRSSARWPIGTDGRASVGT